MLDEQQGGHQARQVGKYRLIVELGKGGMANVYLAVVQGPAGFNKLMVVKFLKADLASEASFVSMFLDEARLAARLSHPNVVQTMEVGVEGSQSYIAMEYLDGQPLNRVLSRVHRGSDFPLRMQLRVLCDMLTGLHYAHELADYDGTSLQVVHRDVTPHNVFLTYDGQVKVVDFGIAKALSSTNHTQTGTLKGKVAYMAPEQARGDALDRRADVFAAGIMLWEALAGVRMWKGLADVPILQRLVMGQLPRVTDFKPDAPASLVEIATKALSQAPADRYATALELRDAIEKHLSLVGERATTTELGEWLRETFADDRAKMKGILEAQLSKASSLPTSEFLSLSMPSVAGMMSTTSGSHSPSFTPASGSFPVPSSQPGGGNTHSQMSSANSLRVAPDPPPAGNWKGMLLGSLVTSAAVGIGIAFFSGHSTDTAASADGRAAASATASSAAPAEVEIRISVQPPEAQLSWDDKPLPGNPYKGRFALDGKTHHLTVKANGYVDRSQDVDLGSTSEINLTLEKERDAKSDKPADKNQGSSASHGGSMTRTVATAAATTAPAATTAAPTDSPKLEPGKKPKRTIDKDVPYP